MKDEPFTQERLLTELIAAYDLLNDAYWLALRQLTHGGVSVSDQWTFWEHFHALDVILDDDLAFCASDSRDDATTRPAADENPFYLRADALREALRTLDALRNVASSP